jgi:hypothetical protein
LGDFVPFSWIVPRISRIELSLWKMTSSAILSPQHPQNDKWSKCLAKHSYRQKSWSKKGVKLSIIFVMDFVILRFILGSHLIL